MRDDADGPQVALDARVQRIDGLGRHEVRRSDELGTCGSSSCASTRGVLGSQCGAALSIGSRASLGGRVRVWAENTLISTQLATVQRRILEVLRRAEVDELDVAAPACDMRVT